MLAAAGIPVTRTEVAQTPDQAAELAGAIGYPVVLKIVSEQILHKSDIGGVVLGLTDAASVRAAFGDIVARGQAAAGEAAVQGVSVQPEVPAGTEVIVGLLTDPQFGPVVMVGLGGIFVEVFKDVSLRVAPVDHEMAMGMIKEIKGYPILKGVRGKAGVDLEALASVIVNTSRLMMAEQNVLELDINPVMAYEEGALAVDARALLEDEPG
jgi:acyl-CoA synthetase (NDP forming)